MIISIRFFHTRILLPTLFLLAMLPLLAGCSANPATGEQSFTAFMSPEREKEVGKEEHPKIIKAFGGVFDDVEIGAYVANLGARLSQQSEMPDLVWTFTVLNDSKINAFALPGGYVYITRGLLALASNEAEVAGVLSHEIGHVTARHSSQRYSTAVATSLGLQVLGALGQAAGVPGAAGNLAAVGAEIALKSYSREQELESDMLGVRYMTRNGYSPDGMTSFFTKLRAHQRIEGLMMGDGDIAEKSNILATHPRTAERIEQAIELASVSESNGDALNAKEYLSRINKMVFGDDISQGLVRGNSFIHPEIGIRFDVPEGFRIFNTPLKVIAKKGDEAAVVFDMAPQKDVKQSTSLKNYLTNFWGRGLGLRNVERLDVNGMAAVTGSARIRTRDGARNIRIVAVQDEQGSVYRFLYMSDPSLTAELNIPFRNSTYSFRKLTSDEIENAKPYRISLYTVREGDTPTSLANMLPMDEFKAEWFEALNGIKADDKLAIGSTIKLVIE